MLSEEQYFKAKSFLKIYKEGLACLEQIASNNSFHESTARFYEILDEANKKKQLGFDEAGNVVKGEYLKSSYFYRMSKLVDDKVASPLNQRIFDVSTFNQKIDGVISSLQKDIAELKTKK